MRSMRGSRSESSYKDVDTRELIALAVDIVETLRGCKGPGSKTTKRIATPEALIL